MLDPHSDDAGGSPDELQRMTLETELFREAGRTDDLGAFLDLVGEPLRRALSADRLLVRRFDPHGSRLVTVGAVGAEPIATPALSPRVYAELSAAVENGDVLVGRLRDELDVFRHLAPDGWVGCFAAAPLRGRQGLEGVLVVARTSGIPFEPAVLDALGRFADPVGVALEHDRRAHEVARIHAATVADRKALLDRLGRTSLEDVVVGEDDGLSEVMARVAQVAPTDATVLLLGETGSGKEVVARAIHTRSARAEGPIVRVNCGAIPPELTDSELFGHERGAFTGAVATRQGWFERADGGTLFLDEIGELPLPAQVRLLRVLQEGVIERVGSGKPIAVDVRIVAATHRDLSAMVERGEFREDLWYRIGVFPIRIPPLRERLADVRALATHFAAKSGRRLVGRPISVSDDDVVLLQGYPWPGNVRELASVIERAAILGSGRTLALRAALGAAVQPAAPATIPPPRDPVESRPDRSAFPTLEQAMRVHIERALERTAGVIEGPTGAAALLDINPHTLRSRMRKLGVDWARFRGCTDAD